MSEASSLVWRVGQRVTFDTVEDREPLEYLPGANVPVRDEVTWTGVIRTARRGCCLVKFDNGKEILVSEEDLSATDAAANDVAEKQAEIRELGEVVRQQKKAAKAAPPPKATAEPRVPGLHVHQAMCEVKKVLAAHGGITKDRTAPVGGGYAFRGIDDMYNVLCELTARFGLVLYPRIVGEPRVEYQTHRKVGRGGEVLENLQTHVHILMDVDIVSAVDGSMHTIRTAGEAIDTGDKATNKAMSAAMKYACIMSFQIPTHGEDDTEAHVVDVAPAAPKSAPARPGPAKAPVAGPDEAAWIQEMTQALGASRSFKLLHDLARDVDGHVEPGRGLVFNVIHARCAELCAAAPTLAALKEAEPLIADLGKARALMTAYNTRYAQLRQQPNGTQARS